MLNGHESEKGLMFTPLSDLIDLSADPVEEALFNIN